MTSFAVVDTETTGLGDRDRVVEIAVVKLDEHGRIIEEWDSLVNPERDVGPTHIHNITPSMISMAPRFTEVLGQFEQLVSGSILVAHNLPFDLRMISNELQRDNRSWLPGRGIDTLGLTRQKLALACTSYGIQISQAHCALGDAQATAQLLQTIFTPELLNDVEEAFITPGSAVKKRTLRRPAFENPGPESIVASAARQLDFSNYDPSALGYLDLLDRALDDLVLTPDEAASLDRLATMADLDYQRRNLIHQQYFADLRAAAERDGIVTADEIEHLSKVANIFGFDLSSAVPETTRPRISDRRKLEPAARICFTGQAVDGAGNPLDRDDLAELAHRNGFRVDERLTKKNTEALVAADINSFSTKVQKARKWDIPVVSFDEFLKACGQTTS